MRMKNLAAACLLALSTIVRGEAEPQSVAPTLTLKDAVDAALASGDDTRLAAATLESARAQAALARSKGGLSLSGTGSYSLSDGSDLSEGTAAFKLLSASEGATHKVGAGLSLAAGGGTSIGLTASQTMAPDTSYQSTVIGASLAQTVWDGYPGGQTRAAIDKAGLALQKQELAAALSESSIAAAAKKSYVTMLTAQRTVALDASLLDKQNAFLGQVEATFALRQSSAIDIMAARIAARKAELDLETARHDLDLARRRLAALIGRAADSDFDVAELEEPELPAPSIDEAVRIGLSGRADAAQLELSRRSAAIDLSLAQAASQAGVSMTAGFNMAMVEGGAPSTAGQASLGLKLSLPILDAGSARAQVRQAGAQLASFDAQASTLGKGIAADIRDAYWGATILRDRIALAKSNQEMYAKQLELVLAQFEYGTATNQDILTAQANAASAGAAYLAAKGDYLLKVIALETAMGL
jgi:outer membrane protein TolC